MCRMQYTWVEPVSCQPFCRSFNALLIDSCMSETMQTESPCVACFLRFFRKNSILPWSHLRLAQRQLESFCCSHLVLPQAISSLCTCHTTKSHQHGQLVYSTWTHGCMDKRPKIDDEIMSLPSRQFASSNRIRFLALSPSSHSKNFKHLNPKRKGWKMWFQEPKEVGDIYNNEHDSTTTTKSGATSYCSSWFSWCYYCPVVG